jgi:hypothetical protein
VSIEVLVFQDFELALHVAVEIDDYVMVLAVLSLLLVLELELLQISHLRFCLLILYIQCKMLVLLLKLWLEHLLS